jgi:hypothetical protein
MSLTVVDNANGTATATLAGTAGGANTVYVLSVDDAALGANWTAAGTRTGDGTIVLTLASGFYFAYLLTNPSAVSAPVLFGVTASVLAVPDRCFAAVAARMALLALANSVGTLLKVYDYPIVEDPNIRYPLVILTSDGGRQTDEKALNGRDDWGHPVRALIRDVVPKFDEAAKTRFRSWRQGITRAFHNQRLPGVIESVRNKVEPGALLKRIPGEQFKNIAESELVIRCITREVRGLGA